MATQEKDHYKVLGITPKASKQQIEQAYSRLSAQWHPEKHLENRIEAQRRFNQITEAYYVLSDQARRDSYDQLTHSKFGFEDANRTFEKFFTESDAIQQKEKQFLDKYYPNRKRTYYEILGIHKNASLREIQDAYRKLALKYHPRNNPNDPQAERRFTQICEAYNNLSDARKRANYDEFRFGTVVPFRAHRIFENFFHEFPNLFEAERGFFSPLLKKPLALVDTVFDDWGLGGVTPFGKMISPSTEYAETKKTHTIREKTQEGITGKTITEKSVYKDGVRTNIKTEQVLKPDGTKEITETIDKDGDVKTNKYNLGPGQEYKRIKM